MRTFEERFWAKVNKTETCWLWTGSLNLYGYGQQHAPGLGNRGAHRLAYEALVGPIPAGLQLDHLCRVRHCVRPDHLEPVELRENVLRGIGISAVNSTLTACRQGHEFTEGNTYLYRGKRNCRACRAEATARYEASGRRQLTRRAA